MNLGTAIGILTAVTFAGITGSLILDFLAEPHRDPTTPLEVNSYLTARRALNRARRIHPDNTASADNAARERHLNTVQLWAAGEQRRARPGGHYRLRLDMLMAQASQLLNCTCARPGSESDNIAPNTTGKQTTR